MDHIIIVTSHGIASHLITSHHILAHMRISSGMGNRILHLITSHHISWHRITLHLIASHHVSLGGPEHTHPDQLQPLFTTHDPAWDQDNISYQQLKCNIKSPILRICIFL